MPRFFLDPGNWGADAALEDGEATHCSRVLRAAVGDRIEVFDGDGRRAAARIRSITNRRVALDLGEIGHEARPARPLGLGIAVLKGRAMDWLVQKAVELGVATIQPLATDHAVAKPAAGVEEKWRRTALEACKQCGRARLPAIGPVIPLADFLSPPPPGLKVMASLYEGAEPLAAVVGSDSGGGEVWLLVGPEGDFSDAENRAAESAGFRPAAFGPRVLRSETAALFGLCALDYALGNGDERGRNPAG
jgi:16S rRNA (uracil1498-N3)-methyltransferase